MLRLLGILSLGHLLLGGRHHRLRRGLFLGGLLGFLASRHFDTDRAAEDIRDAARNARRTAHDAARTAHDAARTARREIRHAMHDRKVDEIHEKIDARRAEREERLNALHAEIEARKARRAESREAEVQNAEVRSAEIRSTRWNTALSVPCRFAIRTRRRKSGNWRKVWNGTPGRRPWRLTSRRLISRMKTGSISPPGSTDTRNKKRRLAAIRLVISL